MLSVNATNLNFSGFKTYNKKKMTGHVTECWLLELLLGERGKGAAAANPDNANVTKTNACSRAREFMIMPSVRS